MADARSGPLVTTRMNSRTAQAVNTLLSELGLAHADTARTLQVTGSDPVVPTPFALGCAASAALGAQGIAIAEIWKLRGGRAQHVSVNAARAVVPGLYAVAAVAQNGHSVQLGYAPVGFYRTGDERHVYLVGSQYRSQERYGILETLACGNTPEAVARAVSGWKAQDLEDVLEARGLPAGVMVRSAEEWRGHPQGRWLAQQPVVSIEKIADSRPEPFAPAARPLSNLRVLDMTHVMAGPVASRMLAEQGAEVLHVFPPNRSYRLVMTFDTDIGKRSAFIDMERPGDLERLQDLAGDADVFVQSWRPGRLERRGLSPAALAARRPGLIYVSVSAYGDGGPWGLRGGYDPLAQSATGIALSQGSAADPQLVPAGAITSYLSGYLAAAGALAALIRRAAEGGSYHVRVSLARTAMWAQGLGPVAGAHAHIAMPHLNPSHLMNLHSTFGHLRVAAPIIQYSETPGYWERPPEPVGASTPNWLEA